MKKQLFILLSLIALLVTAQVPQRFNKVIVTGDIVSPKFIRTGSTSDSVLLGNGSARSVNSIKTDTASLSRRISLKQDTLPFPEVRTGDTFLNDLGTFSAPPSSGGGSASGTPVYFLPTNSPTSGYKELDYTPYSSVVENTYSIPVGTTLLSSHLTDLQIAATAIDAGNWYISSRSKVNNLSGTTKLHVDFFLYHLDGTKTFLFGGDSEIFSTTDYKVYAGQLPEASFPCTTTDRLGVSIYAINSGGATKTLTISLGRGIATFFSAPLRIRHSNLRDKNGEAAFQHVTTDQISTWNGKQNQINGTGFVKANGGSLTFDNNTYSTDIHSNISDLNSVSGTNTGDETLTSIKTKLGITTLSGSNTGDNAVNSLYSGLVSFPGFGTTHTTSAYGDHLHTGTYEVPLTFSTGLTRTGNTITNNITQYTDAMARSAQLTANSTTTGLLTSADWNTFNNKQPAGSYAPASGSVNYIQNQNRSAQSASGMIDGSFTSGELQAKSLATPGTKTQFKVLNSYSGDYMTIAVNDTKTDISHIESAVDAANGYGNINFITNAAEGVNPTLGGFSFRGPSTTFLRILNTGAATFASTVNATQLQSTVATGTAPLTVNSTTMVSNLNAQYFENQSKSDFLLLSPNSGTPSNGNFAIGNYNSRNFIQSHSEAPLDINPLGNIVTINGYTSYHSGNLTNALTTNYLPKWNGSNFVNSFISDDGNGISVGNQSTGGVSLVSGNGVNSGYLAIKNPGNTRVGYIGYYNDKMYYNSDINGHLFNNCVTIGGTTASTSPTTGALVTPGGIGVGGVSHFGDDIVASSTIQASEFVKSGGTPSQFLKADGSVDATNYQPAITLTTNGTSGAATFSGGTLNIPNYSTLNGNFISATVNKTSTRTLTNNDCWVSCENTTTITLPITASIGKVFYIKGNPYGVGSDVTIECNENFDLIQNLSDYITSYTISSGTAKTIMLVWDGYRWQLTTLN